MNGVFEELTHCALHLGDSFNSFINEKHIGMWRMFHLETEINRLETAETQGVRYYCM